MISDSPIKVGSGEVLPKLKERLFKKYPVTQEERDCFRIVGSVDAGLGERLVMLANEYFGIKK